uniref:DIX domain-containing protein n=2 Tax=Panagrolaimus sp. JU765 TaxID=591449 RepID=A0AC34QGE8_9BILA
MPSDGEKPDTTSTKVYYYLDGTAPFVSVIPVPPDKICLGDFKKAFDRQNFKYFCKEFDPVLGKEVKVELCYDDQKLQKSENGLIQLVLLPIYKDGGKSSSGNNLVSAGGTLPRTTKGFSGLNDSFQLRKRRSAQTLSSVADETDFGFHRVSLATDPSTVFSRRAGEHLAEEDDYTSSIEEENDHYEESGSLNSSSYRHLTDSEKGSNNKKKTKAYVPSTMSSVTVSSNSLPRVDEIKVSNAAFLGLSVVDHDGGIFISQIKDQECGLEVGDQIIQINHRSFEFLSIQEAIAELRKVAKSKKPITMFVAKRPRVSDDQESEGRLSSVLCDTQPLDVSNWVKTTADVERSRPFKDLELSNNNVFESDAVTDDEERAAYIDRRNGIGAVMVGALKNFKNNNPMHGPMESPANQQSHCSKKENDENDMKLTTETDPVLVLRRMVHPNSGLEIRNRKWLKIPFPDSFVGNDMLHWLSQHVEGFKTKKQLQTYGSMLLSKGFIRHVLDVKVFDKKRYYFFDESIISYRRKIEHQMFSEKRAAALTPGTTEVTFLGSPTYPSQSKPLSKPMPTSCGILPGPSHSFVTQNTYLTGSRAPGMANAQLVKSQPVLSARFPSMSVRSPYYPNMNASPGNWPLSPIYPPQNDRKCDSPQTNDYASMIQGEINSNISPNPPPIGLPFLMGKLKSASPPPNTPNTLSANSSTALLPVPKMHRS